MWECSVRAWLYSTFWERLSRRRPGRAELRCVRVQAGGNITAGLGAGLRNAVLSDTHECLCECVEQKTKTSQIFEIIGHLI